MQAALNLLLWAWLLSAAAPALSVPLATSQINYSCTPDLISTNRGPLPAGLSGDCDHSDSWFNTSFGVQVSYQNAASVNAGMGAGVPNIGTAHATASAHSNGGGSVGAGAGALITYFFAPAPVAATPFDVPLLPINFTAFGEGHWSGDHYGSFSAYAYLGLQDFPTAQFQASSAYGRSDSFGGSVTFWLRPADAVYQPYYAGYIGASCVASARSFPALSPLPPNLGVVTPSSSECSAAADPIIAFDQAAFNALYGSASFNLSDYFALQFSDNVTAPVVELPPIGIPESIGFEWLAIGLLLAVAGRRRP